MGNRFFDTVILFKPAAGAAVEGHDVFGTVLVLQPVLQQVSKQVVVPVPPPFLVERNQEQVGCTQFPQNSS
jgi:hypothetical protein